MRIIKAIVISALFICQSVMADVPEKISNTIHEHFKSSLPSLPIDAIQSTPIQNLYQVTSGPVVMYVTEDGRYAISGDILDLSDGETNITEDSRKQARMNAIEKLGEEHMVIFPAANEKYKITVFTDLDCVYCRKFHAQLESYNKKGMTIRYLAFPRSGNQSSSYDKAVSVWCSEERHKVFNKANLGHPVPPKTCDGHKVDDQFHLGVMTGISGTPSILLQDGTLVPGYFSPDSLLSIIKEAQKKKKS